MVIFEEVTDGIASVALRIRVRAWLTLAALGVVPIATAQTSPVLDPVVVTATRVEERAFDLPVSIDSVGSSVIQQNQLQINLSESLVRVPGIVVANRWNYAQDLQVSSRGFGARANFGVRGIRLYQDGIPATMPDGQGQTGSFSLPSAARIEVMRGPFSSLYGNAAGGVISVFTEDGPVPPQIQGQFIGGSYGTSNSILKVEGATAGFGGVFAANAFVTDGYREHSHATRNLTNTKLKFEVGADTTVTLIGNSLYQPDAQDPLGLTHAEWLADPRQSDPVSVLFNTRKTVDQQQGGVAIEHRLGPDTLLRITGYGGQRGVRQYLALSGVGATSSGGVSDLDNDFGGIDARISQRFNVGGGPLLFTVGATYDRQHQRRKGFVNNNGDLGDLRRDEDDYVSNGDAYAQAEWTPLSWLSVMAGIRTSDVRFSSVDHYINAQNPDDSGGVTYSHTSPVIGAVWHVNDEFNVYANYGEGFETPSFIELAYRTVGTGLNFDLLPSISHSGEVGIKAYPTKDQRVTLAAFTTKTSNELIIDTAVGGRTTYKNASQTQRRGVEAEWEATLLPGLTAYASYTYLSAKFAAEATTGVPPQVIPVGARLPGVPASNAYAELAWSHPQWYGFSTGAEVQYAGKVYVNDRNTDFAPSYVVANVRAGFQQQVTTWTFREFARINNITNRNYVGSVIVGDTNNRYFEPSAERNFIIGVSANVTF